MRFVGGVMLSLLLGAGGAHAKPTAPALFCNTYADASTCAGRGTTCQTCHTSTSPTAPDWNAYGIQIVDAVLATWKRSR